MRPPSVSGNRLPRVLCEAGPEFWPSLSHRALQYFYSQRQLRLWAVYTLTASWARFKQTCTCLSLPDTPDPSSASVLITRYDSTGGLKPAFAVRGRSQAGTA